LAIFLHKAIRDLMYSACCARELLDGSMPGSAKR
jgi:hypothetical protein